MKGARKTGSIDMGCINRDMAVLKGMDGLQHQLKAGIVYHCIQC